MDSPSQWASSSPASTGHYGWACAWITHRVGLLISTLAHWLPCPHPGDFPDPGTLIKYFLWMNEWMYEWTNEWWGPAQPPPLQPAVPRGNPGLILRGELIAGVEWWKSISLYDLLLLISRSLPGSPGNCPSASDSCCLKGFVGWHGQQPEEAPQMVCEFQTQW